MKERFAVASLLTCLLVAAAPPEEMCDSRITVLAGEWRIAYTNDAVRFYTIEKDGVVNCTAGEAKLHGRIRVEGSALLLTFEEAIDQVERLTLGVDGRLFIEHYNPRGNFPDRKATESGIGARRK